MDLLTLAEVAARLRTPPATVRYWRHTGFGPKSFKIGARIVYKTADVDSWLESQYAAGGARHEGKAPIG